MHLIYMSAVPQVCTKDIAFIHAKVQPARSRGLLMAPKIDVWEVAIMIIVFIGPSPGVKPIGQTAH